MDRRSFLIGAGGALASLGASAKTRAQGTLRENGGSRSLLLFLCGDVMTGRGIDQVLPHRVEPTIYESYVRDARRYVELAEAVSGPIDEPVAFSYVWGDALRELEERKPDLRIVNLETAVTNSDDYWPAKGINYRMHPGNVLVLSTAKLDCCALANNHVLDWGYTGLAETLSSLHGTGVRTAGAGRNLQEARAPAIFDMADRGRVIVFSLGTTSSGIPAQWAAGETRAGVDLIHELSPEAVKEIAVRVRRVKKPEDLVVASVHWGSNWGYEVPAVQQRFAHRLIDEAEVDVLHGHSSHHPRPLELYRGKPILYGCGDFLNDYEGIGGYERFRSDLVLMYWLRLNAETRTVLRLTMTPMQIRRFQLRRCAPQDAAWLRETLDRECRPHRTRVQLQSDGRLEVYAAPRA